jgi:hypothetical protein
MDERNFERVQVDKVVACSTARGAQQVLLYNLSVDGCMIECEGAPLAKGEEVTLSLTDLGRARGRVVWQAGVNAGVQFSHRIHDAAVQHLGFKPSPNCFDELWPVDRFGRPLTRLEPPRTRLSNHLRGYQPH